MEYVGIDLHKKESQICLLTETGEVMERRIRTEPQRFAEVLGGRPRARILRMAAMSLSISYVLARGWSDSRRRRVPTAITRDRSHTSVTN